MSATELAGRVLKSLKDEEWRTLAALERSSFGHGATDIGRLTHSARLPRDRVNFAAEALIKKGLALRRGGGFSLTRQGVEVMALKDYVRKDLIFALGAIIAKGKESDVYEVLNEEGSPFALKFYKIGRTSFTNVRKRRAVDPLSIGSWMSANYEAAHREYLALRKLEGLSKAFPKAIAYSRSTVLLEQLSGVRISQRPYLEDPARAMQAVFDAMKIAFLKAKLVSADLSEYNILTNGASVWLIDWPQAVEATHPNSEELLRHDVETVVEFFRRAYGLGQDPQKVFMFVSGKKRRLE